MPLLIYFVWNTRFSTPFHSPLPPCARRQSAEAEALRLKATEKLVGDKQREVPRGLPSGRFSFPLSVSESQATGEGIEIISSTNEKEFRKNLAVFLETFFTQSSFHTGKLATRYPQYLSSRPSHPSRSKSHDASSFIDSICDVGGEGGGAFAFTSFWV